MKKAFLFLATAALILSGCAKENFNKLTGRDGVVTFTVSVPDAGTRAVTHTDGAAAKINHWIMEVIDADGALYNRQAKNGTVGTLTQTFEVSLVKNQTYTVLFWADSVDTNAQGAYNTASLRDVKLVNATGYVANEDSRDAFSAVVSNFESTSATSANNVTLTRPFAQMNVVFTDLAKLYETMGNVTEYNKYVPVNFKATAKIPTSFNVMTQTAGDPATTALNNTAATNYCNNYANHTGADILYMDYIFATAGAKDIVDVNFEFYSKGSKIAHTLTSIPFQRNYRTNIMGDFMTSNAKWNVTVDPVWITPEYEEEIRMASTLEEAQKAVQKSSDKPVVIQVGDEAIDNATTDDVVEVGGKKYLQFILKTTSPENVKFELPEISSEDATRLGADTWLITYEANYPTEVVAVEATDGAKLKIEAPTSHVEVVGTTFAEITAKTGDETLVIPAGVTVNKLIVLKGGLEIHGVVLAAEVNVTAPDKVYVRDCEGLSAAVYNVLAPYIDVNNGYAGVQCGEKWNIVKGAADVVAKIGEKSYYTFEKAWAEVQTNETITMLANVVLSSELATKDKVVTIDVNGQTLTSTAGNFVNQWKVGEIHFTGAGAVNVTGNIRLYNTGAVVSFDNTFTGTIDYNKVERVSNQGTFKLYGGYFNPKTDYSEATYNTYIPEGYYIESITEGTYAGYKKATQITPEIANFKVGELYFIDAKKACAEWNKADGNTLKVLKDIIVTYIFDANPGENKTLTLDLNGKKLSTNYSQDIVDVWSGKLIVTGNGTLETVNTTTYALDVNSGSEAEIQNGTFNTKIKANGNGLTIADGTFTGSIFAGSNATINGGTFNGGMQLQPGKTATINGGTFTNGVVPFGTLNVTAGTIDYITGQSGAVVNISGGTIAALYKNSATWNITGGTFGVDPSPVADGYFAQAQGTDPESWKVIEDPFAGKVAKIGEVGYSTLPEAFNAVKANETITLLDNVTLSNSYTYDNPVAITKSGVVLDLNGKTITSNVSSSLKVKGTTSSNVNDVIIKNGSLNVPGVATARYAVCAEYAKGLKFQDVSMNGGANISYNSTAEFDDCTIYLDLSTAGSNYYAIYVQQGGSVTILDGEYTATNNGSVVNLTSGTTATIKGGTFIGNPVSPKNASQACYYLSGGSFQFQTDAYWPLTSSVAWIKIEEGYSCTKKQEKVNNITTQFRVVSKSN